MLQFLYPIGLLALAGLIIPVIIHLWNVKQGKTLKIGSIILLGESSPTHARNFKINDWLLFVLRCLLLIFLSFLLAQPYLKKTKISKSNTGWVLAERAKFAEVYKQNRKTIDSLLQRGYEIHDFNIGFAPLLLKDTLPKTEQSSPLNYTALLNQLNKLVPHEAQVYLFADRRLNHFENVRPTVYYNLNWKTLEQTDTMSNWISTYAGKKYNATSSPGYTIYQPLVNQDIEPLRISLYQPPGYNDRKYLLAALHAISSFSKRPIEINPASGKTNLGFWLSADPVSADFKSAIEPNGTLFQYEKGTVVTERSFIDIDGHSIELNKRIVSNIQAKKIWADAFGNPILSKDKTAGLNRYHFNSRFNPQWNQLVWSEAFVKALMPIVIADEKASDFGFEAQPADQRILATNQKETIYTNTLSAQVNITQTEKMAALCWVVALLILIAERILSFRKQHRYVKS